jgi:hypothetical protein
MLWTLSKRERVDIILKHLCPDGFSFKKVICLEETTNTTARIYNKRKNAYESKLVYYKDLSKIVDPYETENILLVDDMKVRC